MAVKRYQVRLQMSNCSRSTGSTGSTGNHLISRSLRLVGGSQPAFARRPLCKRGNVASFPHDPTDVRGAHAPAGPFQLLAWWASCGLPQLRAMRMPLDRARLHELLRESEAQIREDRGKDSLFWQAYFSLFG